MTFMLFTLNHSENTDVPSTNYVKRKPQIDFSFFMTTHAIIDWGGTALPNFLVVHPTYFDCCLIDSSLASEGPL